MGKVPGTRAKKKRLPDAPGAVDATDDSGYTSVDHGQSCPARAVTVPPRLSVHNAFENSSLDWMNELQHPYETDIMSLDGVAFANMMNEFDPTYGGGRTTTPSHHSSVMSPEGNDVSRNDDPIIPAADFTAGAITRDGDSNSHRNRDKDHDNTTRIEPTVGHASNVENQSRIEVDSHCVLACTEIINDLERYVLAELKALDLCLAVVRQTVDDLRRLVDTQQASRNVRCMALFSVIAYQIIELLEVGCAAFLSESEGGPERVVSQRLRTGSTSGLGLGAFRMGIREQRAWRTDIALKDIKQSSELLQDIVALARLGPLRNHQGSPEERVSCYSDLQRRFAVLQQRLGDQK